MIIHTNNPINKARLELFKSLHNNHTIQTVNYCEIDKDINTLVDIKLGEERKEILLEIQELLRTN